jgi:hypothetical protein
MNTRLKQKSNHITFNALTFYAAGNNNRGVRARAQLSTGLYVEVYGGFTDHSDGATTFDARIVNSEGVTCRVPGYPGLLRGVNQDDITCFMMQAQTRSKPKPIKQKQND